MIYEIETIIVACIIFERMIKIKDFLYGKISFKIFLSNIINIPNPYE